MSCGGIAAWIISIGVERAKPIPNAQTASSVSCVAYETLGVKKA
jgi:hypothetical protein